MDKVTAVARNVIKFDMPQTSPAQIFLAAFHDELKDARPVETTELEAISLALKDDLENTSLGYFSHEDWEKIAQEAGKKLAHLARQSQGNLRDNWIEVVRSFHGQQSWGFAHRHKKPKTIRPPETTDGLGGYLWAIFQPMTVTKVAVLWFGAKVAENPKDKTSKIFLLLSISYMFFSLCYFAWRQNQKNIKKSE